MTKCALCAWPECGSTGRSCAWRLVKNAGGHDQHRALAFEGRGLALGFDFGRTSAEFRYQLDDGPWQLAERDRPDWCPPDGWYRLFHVADDLPPGRHRFALEVVHGNPAGDFSRAAQYAGTNFDLALIGVLP